jgi:hypothetical protein
VPDRFPVLDRSTNASILDINLSSPAEFVVLGTMDSLLQAVIDTPIKPKRQKTPSAKRVLGFGFWVLGFGFHHSWF